MPPSPSTPPVVVLTDLSVAACEAVAYAVRMARTMGARLHAVYVLGWPDAGLFERPGDAPGGDTPDDETARALLALGASLGDAAGDAERHVIRSNAPALSLADYAAGVGAGLIVLGAPETPRHDALSPVAAELLQTAPCDVLVVPRRPEDTRANAPASRSPVARVLVPTDLSASARPLAVFGADLARRLGAAGLDLVHVVEPLPFPARWIDDRLVARTVELQERTLTALQRIADSIAGGVEGSGSAGSGPAAASLDVGVYVERGKVARTVCRVAEALGSDLVVVGPHTGGSFMDRTLGSVAEAIVRRAGLPVLVARRSAWPPAPIEALLEAGLVPTVGDPSVEVPW